MSGNAFDHLKDTFFQECTELLDSAYAHLAALADGQSDNETVNAIFRAFHSIKGGGGAFGFDRMVRFAHGLETLLDLFRDGKIPMTRDLGVLLVRATDTLSDLINADRACKDLAAGFEDPLLRALEAAAGTEAAAPPHRALTPSLATVMQTWRIRLRPHPSLFNNASEPLLLIRELGRIGRPMVTADLDRLPPFDRLDPETAYLGWTIDLETEAPRARIEEVFEFVNDQCDVSIEQAGSEAAPPTPAVPETTVQAPRTELTETRRPDMPAAAQSVRVDVEKVDRLVNLVGELVINQAMLVQMGALLPSDMCPGLINGLETLSQHLRELQDGVMAIRTQPVRSVFSRMPRLVRELSGQLGKEARLVITGEGTEIDKTVIEQLADPLTHLLRNAIDHGLEPPADRIAVGKPPEGRIHLAAEHRSGRIVIEVSDDGRGINRDRVLAKARSRGLIADDAQPGDEEIDNLIFHPGLSTSDTVSNVSGRGVGMDVVRRNIQALGGRITVQSRKGTGSRFLLSLPLTLAILDGMIVAVGRESYIVPLTNIVESLRPRRRDIHAVVGSGDVVAIRGEYVPLLYLARHFGVPAAEEDASRGIVVVVENESAGQVGLVVDELLGQQQVVVKSLEANYGYVEGVGGATILGNGRVALILDIASLHGTASMSSPIASRGSAEPTLFGDSATAPTLQ
jgi:two-component system chemotaxis sensor kinase CheA